MQLCGANSCVAKLAQDMPELISDEEDDNVPIPTFQTDQEWRQAIASFRGKYGARMLRVSSCCSLWTAKLSARSEPLCYTSEQCASCSL